MGKRRTRKMREIEAIEEEEEGKKERRWRCEHRRDGTTEPLNHLSHLNTMPGKSTDRQIDVTTAYIKEERERTLQEREIKR